MSILDCFEAMPNRIRALAEVAASEREMAGDELARRFVPGAANTDQFKQLLRETKRLGVLVEDKKTKGLSLSPALSKKKISNRSEFVAFYRACLLSGSGEDCPGNEAFPRALAWLLTRPIGPNLGVGSEFRSALLNDLNGEDFYEINSADRSRMLVYWAQALGFGEWLSFKGTNYFNPDPTRALSATLGNVMEKKHQTPIFDALEKVGREMAVFETGCIRQEIEVRLKTPRDPNYVSPSTSLALLRLELSGTIKLDHQADAQTLLLSTFNQQDKAVSHITLLRS
jgi:hypothetical protein